VVLIVLIVNNDYRWDAVDGWLPSLSLDEEDEERGNRGEKNKKKIGSTREISLPNTDSLCARQNAS